MEEGMAAPLEQPTEGVVDDIDIRRSTLQVEQKRIFLNLRENSRGRYLRIAEVTGNNRSTIIIPSSGLIQFRGLLDEYIEYVTTAQMGQQAMMPMGEFGVGAAKKKKRGKKPMGSGENGAEGEGGDGEEERRVFVGNLSWATTWQGLKDHFAGCGEVTRADVFMERSGRSRGCGIVEFANVDQAKAAMASMNNTELDGRLVFVREDRG
mmetsp:Transcript_34160/g.80562  ORF Transcript_34160/g.80562 Transcript_34160/m.80562 type:complete len:208 (-) Transcript_34160:196-819(-)